MVNPIPATATLQRIISELTRDPPNPAVVFVSNSRAIHGVTWSRGAYEGGSHGVRAQRATTVDSLEFYPSSSADTTSVGERHGDEPRIAVWSVTLYWTIIMSIIMWLRLCLIRDNNQKQMYPRVIHSLSCARLVNDEASQQHRAHGIYFPAPVLSVGNEQPASQRQFPT